MTPAQHVRFRPGARTRLTIRKEVQPQSGSTGTPPRIEALAVNVAMDKHKAR